MGSGKSKKVRVPVYPAIQGPMVATMVARANQAAQNVNVPTLAELFPYMNQNPFFGMQQGTIPTQNMSGAGRFLGPQVTNMPTYTPTAVNYGYTPQQSALLNALMNPGMNMTSGVNSNMGDMATPQFSFNIK